ncbi:MAG: hypothetical protein JWM80_2444 [Cyanobacteria bacterium RYN_339]|nr:hypothetical protein [Cyanobacteria bacterium RYN_339]
MPQREELHKLVETLPAQELHAALRYMQYLCGQLPAGNGVLVVDDPEHGPDAPETPEEQAAWRDYEAHLASSMKTLADDLVADD